MHDALEELITCGDTSFNAQDMILRVARLGDVVPGKEITGFEEQFNVRMYVYCTYVIHYNHILRRAQFTE